MGFMDKFKDMAAQAQETAAQVTPNAGDMGYAQLANKLAQSGVPCTATVRSATPTGQQDMSGIQVAIDVSVEGNGEPYDATVTQYFPEAMVASYELNGGWLRIRPAKVGKRAFLGNSGMAAGGRSVPRDVLDKHLKRDAVARLRDDYRNAPDPRFLTHGPKTRREFLNLQRWSGGHA